MSSPEEMQEGLVRSRGLFCQRKKLTSRENEKRRKELLETCRTVVGEWTDIGSAGQPGHRTLDTV